ncbi:MAG: FAD-dependent oxidoreductase [Alphaproteobacteria bacterium]|nr:FAD-dependent oxidoreductase [Alphaproteobacteria bacterium]
MTRAAIVGAGPAGAAVSEVLSAAGIAHALYDEQPRAGGNIGRRRFDAPALPPEEVPLCDYRGGRRVLRVSNDRSVEWDDGAAIRRQGYEAVFLCAGAYDGMLPRPGRFASWTSAGALQALLKGQGVVPEGRVLICGAGPFLHVVAADLVAAGVAVVAVVDALPRRAYVNLLPRAMAVPANVKMMIDVQRRLHRAGVALRFGHRVVALGARDAVLDDGTRYDFDHVGISDWFAPQTQLARSAGCTQAWSATGRYFHTRVDADYRSDVPGIFVCGEGAGVRGGPHARHSGLIAALAWLAERGTPAPERYGLAALRAQALGLTRFGQALEEAATSREPRLDDDGWACACERVPVARVRQAVADGLEDLSSIKIVTRCGMGPCQGRYCEPLVGRLVAEGGTAPRSALTQKVLARPLAVRELIGG